MKIIGQLIWGMMLLMLGFQAVAQTYVESGLKVIYLRESGSGVDGNHAAIKLDNPNSLEAGCFEDILILDATTDEGKATYKALQAIQDSGASLKSISYTRDEEGDCHLVSYEK